MKRIISLIKEKRKIKLRVERFEDRKHVLLCLFRYASFSNNNETILKLEKDWHDLHNEYCDIVGLNG